MAEKDETAGDAALAETMKLGGTAIKPIGWDRTGWEAVRYTIWNPDTGEVMTRTPLSWFKITLFYCVYYSCLAAFWIACLQIFFCTLPEVVDGPRWKKDYSIIGVNPGVGLRPRNQDAKIDSQMFVLKDGDTNLFPSARKGEGAINADYATRMQEFLKVYDLPVAPGRDYNEFDVSTLGQCATFPYGYVDEGAGKPVSPCIFVKLNAIWGWDPAPVRCGTDAECPDGACPIAEDEKDQKDYCPPSLKAHLDGVNGTSAAGANNVWIDCNGRYAADQEALDESGLQYFPKSRAISMDYFPYKGKEKDESGEVTAAYHSPLVAIKVNPANKGQMVHIECRAYYHGVKHITKSREGLVQFEVHILA